MSESFAERIDRDGFALIPGVLTHQQVESARTALGAPGIAGRRSMLREPFVAEIAYSKTLLDLVRPHTGDDPRPVRAILFDKNVEANWPVAWHQDLTIAVRDRRDMPGFGPWSVKDGIPHVQPPAEVLEQALAVRLHIDAADETNGALRVLPGSHRQGRLGPGQIACLHKSVSEFVCCAAEGDALVMRPLLLHASRRAIAPTRRRVLHVEYAACQLPGGLQWCDAA